MKHLKFALWFLFQFNFINIYKYMAIWEVRIGKFFKRCASGFVDFRKYKHFYSFLDAIILYSNLFPFLDEFQNYLQVCCYQTEKKMNNIGTTVSYVINSCNLQCTETFASFGLIYLIWTLFVEVIWTIIFLRFINPLLQNTYFFYNILMNIFNIEPYRLI